jgi:hypothetical protein
MPASSKTSWIARNRSWSLAKPMISIHPFEWLQQRRQRRIIKPNDNDTECAVLNCSDDSCLQFGPHPRRAISVGRPDKDDRVYFRKRFIDPTGNRVARADLPVVEPDIGARELEWAPSLRAVLLSRLLCDRKVLTWT